MIPPMIRTSTLHEYARIGAAARIKELQEEIAQIRRDFSDLSTPVPERRRPGRPKGQPATQSPPAEAHAQAAPVKRKRRKMSAAARKAISDAQKKRWAAQKKAEKAKA
jgi:hypothetical protein